MRNSQFIKTFIVVYTITFIYIDNSLFGAILYKQHNIGQVFMDFYHGTLIEGIKVLEPKINEESETPFVWASPNFVAAVSHVLKSKKLIHWSSKDGKMILIERFKNSFEYSYKNVSGFVYVVQSDKFEQKVFGNRIQNVSAEPVEVSGVIKIGDAWEKLLEAEKRGYLDLYYYPDVPKGFKTDAPGSEQVIRSLYMLSNNLLKHIKFGKSAICNRVLK